MNRRSHSRWVVVCTLVVLLFSACQPSAPAAGSPTQPPAPAAQPTAASAPTGAPTQLPAGLTGELVLDLSGVAASQTVETIDAVPATSDHPWWEAAPRYRLITLQGYPVTEHLLKPQIFVYPVADLAGYNENSTQRAADLKTLLETRQPADVLPFLPLFNAAQVLHAQAQFLDFKNGSGVRFLTQYDQAPLPINSYELIYTFQGLTTDGQYYVAAVLPVTHPDLPATSAVSTQQVADLTDFAAYRSRTVAWLEGQPAAAFTPDLSALDALVRSIEIR